MGLRVEVLVKAVMTARTFAFGLMRWLLSRGSSLGWRVAWLTLFEHLGDSDGGCHRHGDNFGDHHLVAGRLSSNRVIDGFKILGLNGLV